MKRKRISWLTTLVSLGLVFALVLTGCSGNGNNGGKKEGNSAGAGTEGNTAEEGATDGATSAADLKGTIKVWDWDEAFLQRMVPEFNKLYPNVKVEYTVVNNNDYMQKLQSGIASGSDVPDVLLGEMNYRGQLFDLDVLDNLEAAPYNFSKDQLLDYLPSILSNSKGELVGVDQSITPAGLAFRRDLAKQYLGTEEPAEVAAMLTDWDTFIAKGKEVLAASGGAVTMFASFDDAYRVIREQNSKPYVDGTTINLTDRLQKPLETVFKMRDAGVLGKYEAYTPGWNASFAKGDNLFYPMAPWSAKWNIAANDKDGIGRWGLIPAPEGSYTYGGTSVGVYKGSKNKEAAWAYINFAYMSDEGMAVSYKEFGNMAGTKAFFENHKDWIEAGTDYDKYFAGQNLNKTFLEEIIPTVKADHQTKYNAMVQTAYSSLYPLWMKDTSITAAAAIEKLKNDVKNLAPEATVN
ncbi:multiple sugar transport system substrate-binding protein [Paenibacillus phyllosphaerae]|uniref:Multiple sugar transport system substrate-binding protein n=1 Tax=Paenibacillus phyllosphaerae TaxID=274593 RepID=A0A7W5B228_9BACL|nr:multiple sugar transport system substrate-binding protein [Paenibacillus phyllosphaerae]